MATIKLKVCEGNHNGYKVHAAVYRGIGYRIVREDDGYVVDYCAIPDLWEGLFQHRNGRCIHFVKFQGALRSLKGHISDKYGVAA